MKLSPSQIAQLQGTLLAAKEAIETLVEDEELVPELVKGIIIGVFLGVPQQLKKSLAILGVQDEAGWQKDTEEGPEAPPPPRDQDSGHR